MNQHFKWQFRLASCVFRSSSKCCTFLNVFRPISAQYCGFLFSRSHIAGGTMLEVDDSGMGLVADISKIGLKSPRFRPTNYRKIVHDATQQSKIYACIEQYNEHKVIKDWISNLTESKCHYGEAVFVLGPMGAGKTTVLMEGFMKHSIYKDYAYVDTDELMEKLDGFDSDRVEEFYPVARSIAIKLTDWLLNEKISFIAEGTCVKYLELEDYMGRLKNKGYVIRVKHVNDIPLEDILARTSKRKRKIPADVVKSIYYGSLKGVTELKKMNKNNMLFEEL